MSSMPEKTRELPLVLIRRALLVALLAFLSSVVGLYLLGRAGRPRTTTVRATDLAATEESEQVAMSGRGFDYELTREDEKVFHLQAERVLSDVDENYELAGVTLTLSREGEGEYRLVSKTALYNLETQEASFRGDVEFLGPKGVELRTDGLELRNEGRLVVSSSPVRFAFLGRYTGRANRMRITPKRNDLYLAGKVRVNSLPGAAQPMALRCRRFVFERDEKILRAEGDVQLSRSGDILRARRVSIRLSDNERTVRFVQARWDVSGSMEQLARDGTSSQIELRGHELLVAFEGDPAVPQRAELRRTPRARAALSITDASGLTRSMFADFLTGDFVNGSLRRSQAFEKVEIREFLALAPEASIRRVCSREATTTFLAGGELDELLLDGGVDLHDAGIQAIGERVVSKGPEAPIELQGSPAWVLRENGEMRAPRIVYDRRDQQVEAGDGVRATLTDTDDIALAGDASSQQEPIRVEARRATWSNDPSTVVFSDEVRAWQGENFMLANELVGEVASSRLTASGRVKTVWRPQREAAEAESGAVRLQGEPLEVTADELVYDRQARLLTYAGAVRAVQAKKTMTCVEIQLRLAEDQGFEEMSCQGSARLEDAETGNTVSGEHIVYYPETSLATVTGSPVVMRDGKGGEIQGKELIYDFATGTARVRSAPVTVAEDTEEE
jgi:lipopolysaccharide transport protein LptA